MVTLARSGKGLGGEKWEREGKKFWQDHCPQLGSHRVKAFLFIFLVFNYLSLINGDREMNISST